MRTDKMVSHTCNEGCKDGEHRMDRNEMLALINKLEESEATRTFLRATQEFPDLKDRLIGGLAAMGLAGAMTNTQKLRELQQVVTLAAIKNLAAEAGIEMEEHVEHVPGCGHKHAKVVKASGGSGYGGGGYA